LSLRGVTKTSQYIGDEMEAQRLKEFKNLFNEIRRVNNQQSLHLEDLSFEDNGGDEVDYSSRERDDQLVLKLQGRQNFYNKKIEAALERIENGSFGECEECSDEISLKRLIARPTAELCINCKEEQERSEDILSYNKRSHTHGREIINQNLEAVKSLASGGEAFNMLNH
jgi:DnaK suppressor protein